MTCYSFNFFWYCLGSGLGTIGDFFSEEQLLHDPRWKMVSTFPRMGSGDYVLTFVLIMFCYVLFSILVLT